MIYDICHVSPCDMDYEYQYIYIYIIKRVYALCTIENKATFSGKAFQTAQVDPSVKDAFDAPARRFG